MINTTRFFLLFLITVEFSANYEAFAAIEHTAVETDLARIKRLGQKAIDAYQNKEQELRRYLGDLVINNDSAKFSDRSGDSLVDLLVVHIMGRFFSNFQEILEPLISRENEVRSLSLNNIITTCENDRIQFPLKRVVLRPESIEEDVNLALRNGHILGAKYTGVNTLSEKGTFLCGQIDNQEVLVLGCGKRSQCCNNHSSHYTVDVDYVIEPNCISNIYDKRLWDMFDNQFEEIILEGAGNIKDVLLMTSIFKALKPGGIFKTLHFRPSLWEKDGEYTADAFLYDITIPLIGEPLLLVTYKEHLEAIGFITIETYTPGTEEDLMEPRTEQIRATKPVGVTSARG